MEDIERRLDEHAGTLRALAETVTALVLSASIDSARLALAQLETARVLALEEDELNGTPPAESAARDATMQVYVAALKARA